MKPRHATLLGTLFLSLTSASVTAATLYWDNVGGTANDWGSIANWSTVAGGGTNPAALPASADTLSFSASSVAAAQTINLNAARAVSGMTFTTSYAHSLLAGGANYALSLGTGGITKSGTGAVTIGSATAGQQVAIALAGNQTWANNNNTGAISILNGVAPETATSYALTLGGTSTAANTITGVLANNGAGVLSLTKSGAGLWVLGSTSAVTNNTFTGNVTVNASGGTLKIANKGSAGTATVTTLGSNNTVTVNSGATLHFASDSTSNTLTYANTIALNSATLYFEDGNTTLSGGVALTGSNTINGRWSGKNLTLSGVVSGSGGITKTNTTDTGAVDLILSGANTFTSSATGGVMTVNLGYVRLGNNSALGYTPTVLVANPNVATTTGIKLYNNITIGAGRTLILRNGTGTGNDQRAVLENLSGNNTWAGSIVLESPVAGVRNQTLTSTAGTLTITGNIYNSTTLPSGGMFVRGVGNGVISGNMSLGDAMFLKTDTGSWTINSTGNTQSSTTVASGTLVLNNTGALQAGKPLTLGQGDSNNAVLTINSGFSQNFSAINTIVGGSASHAINGGGTLDTGAAGTALTVNDTSSATDLTISTSISGSGTLTKSGAGTLFFSGTASAPVSITGGTLAGTGAYGGGLSIGSGATLVPGSTSTVAVINAGSLAFGSGATNLLVNAGSLGTDLINVTGANALTQAGTTTVTVTPNGGFANTSTFYPLIAYTGTSPGVGGFTLGTMPGRVVGSITDSGSAIGITATNDRIVWTGAGSGAWDVNTTANWKRSSDSSATNFLSQDDVIFNDDGIAQNSIALSGTINPTQAEFAHTSGTYVLASGTLSGTGNMALNQTGAGTTILRNTNTFVGPVSISAGKLELDVDSGTLSAASVVNVGSSGTFLISKDDGDLAFSRPLSGTGTVRVNPHSLLTGTTAARTASLTGDGSGFSGTLVLESPLIGSSRMNNTPPSALGTAGIVVQNENQFYANNTTYSNNITLTGNGYDDTSGSIGALRMDGGTWNGMIAVTGTPGNSGGTAYDARIGGNGGTNTINGSISGGDLSFWTYLTNSTTFVVTGANSHGDTIIGGSDNNSGSAGTLTFTLGSASGTPTNTTATFGTGNVYLVTGNNATNPVGVALNIRRADGYALAGNILGSSSYSSTLSLLNIVNDTTGAGLTLNGKTIDLSDGTNGGMLRVAAGNSGAILNIDSGSVVDVGSLFLGEASGYAGTINQTGGATTVINQLRVGHYASETSTYNLSGGTVSITSANGATNPFTAGSSEQNGGIYVGVDGTGIVNQSGGTVTTNWVVLDNRSDTAGADQYNLTGGTLKINNTWGISGNASSLFTLGGGTLQVNNAGSINMPVSVAAAVTGTGSVLDTNVAGNTVTFSKDVTGTGTLTTQGGGTVAFTTTGTQTVSAVLAGTSPVTKLGTGTTTMSGLNTYSGATAVNGGRLNLTGGIANSALTMANGTSLGGEGTAGSIIFGGGASDVTSLYIDGSTAGALTSTGTLTVNGTVNVDFTGAPAFSSVVVVNHGGTAGSGTFSLVNSGNYRNPNFVYNTGNVSLSLDAPKALVWNGATTGWEISGSNNDWNSPGTENFYQGDGVTFDDTPAAAQSIAMTGVLKPSSVTFANTAGVAYTLTGAAGNGIGGLIGVSKTGAGTVTLGGDNTFTGGLTISNGALNAGPVGVSTTASSALGGDGNVITVASGGQLNFKGLTQDASRYYSLNIAGTGPDGKGAVTNDTANIYENARILNLTLAGDASVGSYGAAGGNRIDFGRAGSVTGTINGNGHTLTKVGEGIVDMRAPATNISYVVNAGVLRAENTEMAFGSTGVTANNGGTVDSYGTLNFTVPVTLNNGSALTSSNGTATWSGPMTLGGGTASVGGGGATLVISSNIAETTAATLAKITSTTTILTGTNSFTGGVSVDTGILRISSDAALGATPGTPVSNAIVLQNGGRIQDGNASAGLNLTIDSNRGIYLPTGDGGFHVWTGYTMSYGGNVSGAGNFTKSDGGILNYTGTASHTGATSVSSGTLNLTGATLTANNNINITGGSTVNVNTGTTWTTVGTVNLQTATLNITGGSLTAGRFVTDNGSNASTTVNQSGGSVTITGTDSSNTNTASFLFGHWGSGNTSTYNLSGGTLNSTGAELSFGWDTTTSLFNITGGTANLLGLDLGNSRTNLGVFNLSGGRLNLGANGITSSTSKVVNLVGGTLGAFANWSSGQPMALSGGSSVMVIDTLDSVDGTTGRTITLSGVLSGAGGLTKSGAGTLVLSAANTYTGNTTVNGGTLSLNGGGGSGGAIRGTITVNAGATLQLNAGDVTGYGTGSDRLGTINLNGGTMHVSTTANQTLGSAVINMTGATVSGIAGSNIDFYAGASAVNTLASSTTSVISPTTIKLRQAAGVTFTVADGAAAVDLQVDSSIVPAGDANGPLTKAGAGLMLLDGTNSYATATIINAGAIRVSSNSALGTTAAGTTVASGAALQLAANVTIGAEALGLGGTGISDDGALRNISGNNTYGGAITLNTAARVNSDSGTMTLSANITNGANLLTVGGAGDTTISGVIGGGAGGLAKDGSGMLTVSGENTYGGPTTVDGGTLRVNNTTGSGTGTGSVSVTSGTLGGSGTISGAVTIGNGATLAPGNSPGTLTINNDLGLNDTSVLAFELNPLDTTVGGNINDLVTGIGNLSLNGILSVSATGGSFAGVTSGTWRLFDYSGTLTDGGLAFGTMPALGSGYSWEIDTATANQVNLKVIPEPASVLLLGLGSLGLMLRRRRD